MCTNGKRMWRWSNVLEYQRIARMHSNKLSSWVWNTKWWVTNLWHIFQRNVSFNFHILRECIQDCSTADCSSEDMESTEHPHLEAKTIQFVMLSRKYKNVSDHQPILKLVNYDFNKFPLSTSIFSIANKNNLFRIEKSSTKRGISYLYVDRKKITLEKIYKVKIAGSSYKNQNQLTNFKLIIVNLYVY